MIDQDLVAQLRGHNDPRLYHEADVLMSTAADAIEMLQQEVARWKNHHETEVRRARVLKERTDMPLERVQAYEQMGEMQATIARLTEGSAARSRRLGADACDDLLSAGDCCATLPGPSFTAGFDEWMAGTERECCGTFHGSPHRATCPEYCGKFKPSEAGGGK